jgi:hypothetical protein
MNHAYVIRAVADGQRHGLVRCRLDHPDERGLLKGTVTARDNGAYALYGLYEFFFFEDHKPFFFGRNFFILFLIYLLLVFFFSFAVKSNLVY